MTEVTVNVWKLNDANEKYASTLTFKINSVLKDDVIAIFDEIFNSDDKPPIKNATAYAWRNSMASGLYSDHNYGTVIDLNYNENYTVYASGTTIGTFYDPSKSVYSFRLTERLFRHSRSTDGFGAETHGLTEPLIICTSHI